MEIVAPDKGSGVIICRVGTVVEGNAITKQVSIFFSDESPVVSHLMMHCLQFPQSCFPSIRNLLRRLPDRPQR